MRTRSSTLTLTTLAVVLSTSTAAASPLTRTMSGELPVIESSFDRWDICQQVDGMIEHLGLVSQALPRLCNYEMTQSFGVGPAAVSLSGTLTELVVDDGWVRVDGPFEVTVRLTPGTIEGGRPPVFSPCDREMYEGCIATPTGAVCVPGAPIVVEPPRWISGRTIAGYWSGWTWVPPRWIPGRWTSPVIELCVLTDAGELPTVTAPEVEQIVIDAYPRVRADMGVTVAGDGALEIEIPIPYAGAKTGYGNSWLDLNVATGVSLVLDLTVENAGADLDLVFDERLHVRSTYNRSTGWTQTALVLEDSMAPSIVPHSANVTVRASVKLGLEATAMASLGSTETDDSESESEEIELPPLPIDDSVECMAEWLLNGPALQIGFEAKADVSIFVEGSYPLFGDVTPVFDIDGGIELAHAESLSFPGFCEIGCETIAGDDNAACGTTELLRIDIAQL